MLRIEVDCWIELGQNSTRPEFLCVGRKKRQKEINNWPADTPSNSVKSGRALLTTYPGAQSREHVASRDGPQVREVQLTRFCLLKRVMLLIRLTRKSCRCLGTTTTKSTTLPRHKYCSVLALARPRFASQLIHRQLSLFLSTSARARCNVMAPKQATLGYVKPTQQTIGCVDGDGHHKRPWCIQFELLITAGV